jgi:branched-chain amino acid transport system permease protein
VSTFLDYTILGLVVGCIYALSATGLVVTYTTSAVFNFAHGAIGMLAAFTYWQLRVAWGWPSLAALIVVVFVLAPLFGVVVERVLIRGVHGRSADVPLVVTLGLLIFLLGIAQDIWKPNKVFQVTPFFAGHQVRLASVNITYDELIVVGVAVAVAIALRLFFSRTRTGIAMRAVVDDRRLASMMGARPHRISQLSWALGAALAALAGVLLAPLVTLNHVVLTLIIINAFAAAMVGRLRSVTLTVVGALALGLFINYAVGYLPASSTLSRIQLVIPMIFLFIVLIALPQDRLRAGTVQGQRKPAAPPARRSVIAAAGFVVAAFVVSGLLSRENLGTASSGLALGIILLSLLLLTGYGGQISLCQLTFAGLGAWAMSQVGGSHGSLLGVVAALVLAAGCGVVVALPTYRLRGLYLALATLAFAQAMDFIFFNSDWYARSGTILVARVHIPGIPTSSDRAFFMLLAVVFAVAGMVVLSVRRGRWGRRLSALSDSPQASATLGMNINRTRLALFAGSAGLAGLGGALYGGQLHAASFANFQLLNSLVLLLLLLVGGRNTVMGAFLGAMFFALFPILQSHIPQLADIREPLTGLAAIGVARNANGVAGQLADAGARIRQLFVRRRPPTELSAVAGHDDRLGPFEEEERRHAVVAG